MSVDRPDETEAERADRNFTDLLQELRVTQTGVQILFAFLLTMPLQARYTTFDHWDREVYVAALLFAALATICLIAPVAYHRALFARRLKHEVVRVAARFAVLGLAMLGLSIVCALNLVLNLVLGRNPALVISGLTAVVLTFTWAIFPLFKRAEHTPLEHPGGQRA